MRWLGTTRNAYTAPSDMSRRKRKSRFSTKTSAPRKNQLNYGTRNPRVNPYGIHTTQFRPTPSSDSLLKGRWLWTYGYRPIVGHFGDVRLKKGVPIFWIGWLRAEASAFAFAALVAIVQVRCTLRDGFGTHR